MCLTSMVVFAVQADFGVNSSVVYSMFGQTPSNPLRYCHVSLSDSVLVDGLVDLNMKRGYFLGLVQLPEVDW